MTFRRLILASALALGSFAANAAQDARTMTWQGVERHYVVYRPVRTGTGPAPLVIALAGLGQDLDSLRDWLPIEPVADRSGFVVAYPEALGGKWSYWQGGGIAVPGHLETEIDDVGFVAAVVDALVKLGTADPRRVYLTGISRGALMTWTLACRRADLFSAVAPLSSAMTARQLEDCHPSRPLAVVAADGTNDPVQRYDGFIDPPPTPRLLSVPASLEFWWRLSGCTGETSTVLPHVNADDMTRIEADRWTGCSEGAPVMLYRVDGGGHRPPSMATDTQPSHFGRRSRDIETAQAIWDFFAATTATEHDC